MTGTPTTNDEGGTMTVKPIPDDYTSVTPYLTVDDGKAAIEFYKRAFGAIEKSTSKPRRSLAIAQI